MARLRAALARATSTGKICFNSRSASDASADWQKIVKRCVDFAPHGVGMGPALVEAGGNDGETSGLPWSRLMRFPRRTLIPADAARCPGPDFLSDGLACK